MTKEQKDLAWACLPKEARDKLMEWYQTFQYHTDFGNDPIPGVQMKLLEDLYSSHNLTSDTEPKEMLIVSKSKVMERIRYLYSHPAHIAAHKADERASELRSLFGDKCLSDTPNTPKSGELKPQMAENKPKFKVGELAMNYGRVCRVLEYNANNEFPYLIHTLYNNNKTVVHESDLEPYTEENKETEECPYTDGRTCDTCMGKGWECGYKLKETMEEKELNLCELLKGYEGGKSFSQYPLER